MARVRTFIAVDLTSPLRERCAQVQVELALDGASIKWVEKKNLHVTLLFLGEIVDRELHNVCRAVADVAREMEPFALSVRGLGGFPHSRRPRVVWAGIDAGSEELIALHDALEEPLLELGCYRREVRAYTPHLTLGRVESETDSAWVGEKIAEQESWDGGEMEVSAIQVMSSELRREGPIYTVMSTARFSQRATEETEESDD